MARPWQRSLDIMPPSRRDSKPTGAELPVNDGLYPAKLSMGEVNPAFQDDTCVDATEMQAPVSVGSNCTPGGRPDTPTERSATPFYGKAPWNTRLPLFTKVAVAVLFHAYLAAGISLTWSKAPDYCHDVKFLTVVTVIVYVFVLWRLVNTLLGSSGGFCDGCRNLRDRVAVAWVKSRLLRPCTWLLVWLCLLSFLVYDSIKDIQRLISLAGILVLLLIGFIFSNSRFRVNWYQVMWGLLLQFLLGLAVLRWRHGRDALQCIANKVKNFLDYTNSGSHFVFGHLASGWNLTEALGGLVPPSQDMMQNASNATIVPIADTIKSLPAVFMFQALPVILFFSFFVNILYFYGIMQRLVLIVGSFLQLTIGTTVCESMTAAANIFLGMIEAPLVVRPFLSKMTKSELHTVMTGGFATIAGSVMAAYIHFGVSPAHLMTASIMSAPAALAYSKLLYPETEESQTQRENIEMPRSEERNVLEAASNGTTVGLAMIGSIVANLVGFLAFLAFMNSTLQWFGAIVTLDFLTFEWLLAKVFTPLAFIMGVPWKDCGAVGELIGIKTFANEFIAYSRLASVMHQIDERSTVIATYALCGFSNLGSIGICIGGLGAIAPDRKGDLAAVSLRALAAGSAACFLTACVAGSLIP